VLRGLDLTEEQQAQLTALRDAERVQREGPPADVQLRRQLQAELFAEAPDAAKLAAIQQQLVQAHAARLARQVAAEQRIAQILTAEQRAKVRERLSAREAGADPGPRRRDERASQARGPRGDRHPFGF
jgi:Spy/CpxP family protein refolding chaperone